MSFTIRVYTPAYLLTGQSESTNSFLGWLNNTAKQTLELANVDGLCLDPDALLVHFAQPCIVLPKVQIVAIELVSPEALASLSVGDRAERVVLYTARFVIQANLHPPGEMPVTNYFNIMSGSYFPVTHAQLHPIVPTRKLPADCAFLMVVNRCHVDFYHPRT
jgi:hypothetical protein